MGVRIWGFDQQWLYEIYENDRRVEVVRGLESREEANVAAIKAAFMKSERDYFVA